MRVVGIFVQPVRELQEMRYLNTDPLLLDETLLQHLLGPRLKHTSYDDAIAQTLAHYTKYLARRPH
jgi:hypothetical protein